MKTRWRWRERWRCRNEVKVVDDDVDEDILKELKWNHDDDDDEQKVMFHFIYKLYMLWTKKANFYKMWLPHPNFIVFYMKTIGIAGAIRSKFWITLFGRWACFEMLSWKQHKENLKKNIRLIQRNFGSHFGL